MDERAYELLRTSVKRFNEWKANQPTAVELVEAPLAGLSLAKADLSQVNMKGADLSGADLSGANLTGAVMYRVKAAGALLLRCRLDEVYAAESDFTAADLSQARATSANFSRALLQRARLDHARLLDVRFDEADLSEASLVGALLVRTAIPSNDVNMRDAVIENGSRTPRLPSVDFQWIAEDAMTFAIGQWTPRPELPDEKVSTFVRNLRKMARGDDETIKGFGKLIAGLVRSHHRLSVCDSIVCVPSSNAEKTDDPVKAVVSEASRITGLRDGTNWLIRHKSAMPSGLLSLFSDEGKHLDTIRVAHPEVVEGRTVLLFDDFLDTGCSFRACRHLLLAAGAKQVFCVALARRLPREV